MDNTDHLALASSATRAPWDTRLARRLVAPFKNTWVTPNLLTTLRLLVGLAAAGAFLPGTYGWSNVAALLLVLSNFLDHTDGELARMSGKTSRFGHLYDLASDAAVTILVFLAMGVGISGKAAVLGAIAGVAIALIFYLRMRVEDLHGKLAVKQASLGGFETEDVLYLLPLVTLCDGALPMLTVAAVCAPLYCVWVVVDFRRILRRARRFALTTSADTVPPATGVAR